MPFGGGSGEGGFAARGYGGVAQPGGNVSSGVGGGGSNNSGSKSKTGSLALQNFKSLWGAPPQKKPGPKYFGPVVGYDQTPTVDNTIDPNPYGNVEFNNWNTGNFAGNWTEPGWQDVGSVKDWNAAGKPGLTQGGPKGNPPGAGGSNSGQGGMGAGALAGKIFGVGKPLLGSGGGKIGPPKPAFGGIKSGISPNAPAPLLPMPSLSQPSAPRVDPARIRPVSNGPPTITPPAVRTPQFRGSL